MTTTLPWVKHGISVPYYTARALDKSRYALRRDERSGRWRVLCWFPSLGGEQELSRDHRGVVAAKAAAREHYLSTLQVVR